MNNAEDAKEKATVFAQSVRHAADQLLRLHQRAEEWRAGADEARSVNPADLRTRTRTCRHLAGSAARPPTVGVFGESQAGKSYLISCMSGSSGGLVIQEPELARSGSIKGAKAWGKDAKTVGGLSFINWINAQSGNESTALVCRLTRHPVDVPQRADSFAARLLSHEDLLASLCVGYLAEVARDANQKGLIDDQRRALSEVEQGTRVKGSLQKLRDLEAVWKFLESQYPDDPYIEALVEAEFPARIAEFIVSERVPIGSAWARLVGVLWGLGRNQALDDLYARLSRRLEDMQFPAVAEVPTSVVVKKPGDPGQLPLTDVTLLQSIFTDSHPVTVWIRSEEETSLREFSLSRPELSALILELVLPVVPETGKDSIQLLEHADVLDFPGARSEKLQAASSPENSDAAERAAIAVLRRGKLTRLFSALSERREISLLCLAVPKTNLEAPRVVSRLLEGWFKSQPGVSLPDLFVAMTKSDLILKDYPTAKWPKGQRGFGGFIADMKDAYASSDRFRWMDNFGGRVGAFTNVYFVFNPRESLPASVKSLESEIRDHYLTHPMVIAHVASPDAKFDSLMRPDGGVRLFAADVLDRALAHDKHRRLAAELRARRDELLALVEREFVDPARSTTRANPRADAERDVSELERAAADFPRTGRNAISLLLEHLRLTPALAGSVFKRLDRLHGEVVDDGAPLSMSCTDFIDALRKAWTASVASRLSVEGTERSLGVSREVLLSIIHGWTHGVHQPWMTGAMTQTLTPYFESAMGPSRMKEGLVTAAVWTWNRQLVALGESPPEPTPVRLPPALSTPENPAWRWLIEHWRRRLPMVYGGGRQPPAGNEALGGIVAGLKCLEIPA